MWFATHTTSRFAGAAIFWAPLCDRCALTLCGAVCLSNCVIVDCVQEQSVVLMLYVCVCVCVWKQDFEELYKSKLLIFLQELVGVFITPILLYYSLPRSAPLLLDFVNEFTVTIPGANF